MYESCLHLQAEGDEKARKEILVTEATALFMLFPSLPVTLSRNAADMLLPSSPVPAG